MVMPQIKVSKTSATAGADRRTAGGRRSFQRRLLRRLNFWTVPVAAHSRRKTSCASLRRSTALRASPRQSCRNGRDERRPDARLPALDLCGISASDFQEVLTALLGKAAPNLSPAAIARLNGEWEDEYQGWQKRVCRHAPTLTRGRTISIASAEDPQAECMLVLIGATPVTKELIGFRTGMRVSLDLEGIARR